jgi:DNA-directed RNA polymerase subunit beta
MGYKNIKYGRKSERRNYSRMPYNIELPNLIENQKRSFNWFVGDGVAELLKDISPIQGVGGGVGAVNITLSDPVFDLPQLSSCKTDNDYINHAKRCDQNYFKTFKVKATIEKVKTGEQFSDIINFGELPWMTPAGTFVINGAERVVISQIIRSSGVYFKESNELRGEIKKYSGQVNPNHGLWIEYETSIKDIPYVKLDKKKKVDLAVFIRSLGFEKNEIEKWFGGSPILTQSIKLSAAAGLLDNIDAAILDVFNKMSDENYTLSNLAKDKIREKLFDKRKYELLPVGRYKYNKKLDCLTRVRGLILSRDIVDPANGEVLFRAGDVVTDSVIKYLRLHREVLRKEIIKKENSLQNETAAEILTKAVYEEPFTNKTDFDIIPHTLTSDIEYLDANGKSAVLLSSGLPLEAKHFNLIRKNYARLTPESKQYIVDNNIKVVSLVASKSIFSNSTGEEIVKKGNFITDDVVNRLRDNENQLDEDIKKHFLDNDCYELFYSRRPAIVEIIYVNSPINETTKKKEVIVIGNDQRETLEHVTVSDLIASTSYYLNLYSGVGEVDDIDHLGNRRIRLVGELLKNQFKKAFIEIEKAARDSISTANFSLVDLKATKFINTSKLSSAIKSFFGTSQLSQFMDQINSLSELTQKRRISAQGSGGLTRERASVEVRDVHSSHYGRICPIETPEGQSIGLISSLASYSKIDYLGFIQTPYFVVKRDSKGAAIITQEIKYLTADEEFEEVIASAATPLKVIGEGDDRYYTFLNPERKIIGRKYLETGMYPASDVTYMDVSPKQIVSVATSTIPFLEHDDASRALMGSNMQRQAVPLLKPESPYVGTGIEYSIAKDSGNVIVSNVEGYVTYVDAEKIIITKKPTTDVKVSGQILYSEGSEFTFDIAKNLVASLKDESVVFELSTFFRSNQDTNIMQKPLVNISDYIKEGEIIADGTTSQNGELALGKNVIVAFMTFDGYNFEDAVIMSENLVKNDVYTSIHIEEHECNTRDVKGANGSEKITKDLPQINKDDKKLAKLDDDGIIVIGSEVKEDDILVGKVTPKGATESLSVDSILVKILGDKYREHKDSSLKVPHGGGGVVLRVDHFSKENKEDIKEGLNESVKVYVAQKRKIKEGDKMAGRHGNKGVISKILPVEDMPYMADGTPVDIVLNPQGVPSRMNFGQVLEMPVGLACKKLGIKVATPVFDGIIDDDLTALMNEANIDSDGKMVLYDGRTGEPYPKRIGVGVMYMIKLSHMVDDKLHARNTGPYALITQQPMGGKAQNGGQRFGEMEVWALYAYGAAYTLQEMLTYKSDDINGRNSLYTSISKSGKLPTPSIPESFKVLTKELQGLGLYVELIDAKTNENKATESILNSGKGRIK